MSSKQPAPLGTVLREDYEAALGLLGRCKDAFDEVVVERNEALAALREPLDKDALAVAVRSINTTEPWASTVITAYLAALSNQEKPE